MPSSMIHLLAAYKYDSQASASFWIGNIAPDSVNDWKEKDRTHFRDKSDRLSALQELASKINIKDDLNRGILLHLFLDYYWDTYPMKEFILTHNDNNWFQPYRQEIALAGAWLYHHTDWSKRVWDEMVSCPMFLYENIQGFIKEDIADFIHRNSKWHAENNIGPSACFTPQFIDEFTSTVVNEFRNWLSIQIII